MSGEYDETSSDSVWEGDASATDSLPAPIHPSTFRSSAPSSPALSGGYATNLGDLDPYAPSQNAWEDQAGESPIRKNSSPRTLGSIVTPTSRLELLPDLDEPPLDSSSSTSSRTLPVPPPIEQDPPPPPTKSRTRSPPDSPGPGAFIGAMFRTASGSGSLRSTKASTTRVGAEEEKERLRSEYYNEKVSSISPMALLPSSPTLPASPSDPPGSSSSLPNPLASIASAFRAATSSPSNSDSAPSTPSGKPQRVASGRKESRGKDRERETVPVKDTTEIVFDFTKFMEQMRMRSADPVAKYLRSFLKEFSRKPPVSSNDQVRVVNDFLDFIAGKMRNVDPWKEVLAGPDIERAEDEFDLAMEAMEKLVMNRLWHLTFTPALDLSLLPGHVSPTDDLERDQVLTQRIRLFSWIEPRHLDLSVAAAPSTSTATPDIASLSLASSASQSEGAEFTEKQKQKQKQPESKGAGSSRLDTQGFLDFAGRELLKINQYKAPRDKLICILNSCKVIFGLIRHVSNEEGADAFIPFLIYVVLKSNPPHLVSNIQFIQRFRNPEKLSGEGGYYLSSLNGAVSFIETMDSGSLSNITQPEFETYVEKAIQNLPTDPTDTPLRGLPRTSGTSTPNPTSNANDLSHATDIESPSLIQQPGVSLSEATKAFFLRSSDSVERAVSKPLGAIGKILEKFEEQQAPLDRQPSVLDPRRTYEPYTARRPTAPARSNSRSSVRSGRSVASSRSTDPHAGLYVSDGMNAEEVIKEIDRQHELKRQAAIETLTSIFPQIESEVLEMILLSNGGEMAPTIDTVLEMT